jgi:hypothetical protein
VGEPLKRSVRRYLVWSENRKMKWIYILGLLSFVFLGSLNGAHTGIVAECGKVISNYDEQKKETQVQLRPLVLEGVFQTAPGESLVGENHLPNDDHGVALTAIYAYPGKALTKPQAIVIVVESESVSAKYENDRRLRISLDGSVLDFGTCERGVKRTNMGLVREDLSVVISYEQFLEIARAKKAKLSVGPNSFKLTQCQMEALRKLATSIPS